MSDQIKREVLLRSAPAEVWQALTDPARLERWLADEVTLDLRPGGDASFRFGETRRSGWVEDVTAPERLAFWWAQGDQPATRVEITLEPAAGGAATRLRIVETRPMEILDLLGTPLPGLGGNGYGPALLAA